MLKSNFSKIFFIIIILGILVAVNMLLLQNGHESTSRGAFYYTSDYITSNIANASILESKTFILLELLDLFLIIPLYTLSLFIVFDMVMYNFRISPFKALVFFPASMDMAESLILIVNNAYFKSGPILTPIVALLSFSKWTLIIVLLLILIIFLMAKLMGVTGTVKIISYDDLWGNKKNVKTYWTWIIGHVITTIISIFFIVLYMLTHSTHPQVNLKWAAIALLYALLYDYIFNLFCKIPHHIFNKIYNHWLRAVFISLDTIFLMFALSLLKS